MVNRLIFIVCVTVFLLALSISSVKAAQERYALIIGNSGYVSNPLKNPVNDATDLDIKLLELGFDVTRIINADLRRMQDGVREFIKKLKGTNAAALFYFAGHGVGVEGKNYLIPIDEDIKSVEDVPYEAVDVAWIMDKMSTAGNPLNIVLLDACRNNPYAGVSRSATRGLNRIAAPEGSLLVYATQPNKVALDGKGRNGVYTKHLLETLDIPGLSIEQVMKKTAQKVYDASKGKQFPYAEGGIRGDFYFRPLQKNKKIILTSKPDISSELTLDVYVQPSDARVRILNIKPKYHAGMKLPPNRYQIEVSKPGYVKYKTWHELVEGRQTLTVTLEKKVTTDVSVNSGNVNKSLSQYHPGKDDIRTLRKFSRKLDLPELKVSKAVFIKDREKQLVTRTYQPVDKDFIYLTETLRSKSGAKNLKDVTFERLSLAGGIWGQIESKMFSEDGSSSLFSTQRWHASAAEEGLVPGQVIKIQAQQCTNIAIEKSNAATSNGCDNGEYQTISSTYRVLAIEPASVHNVDVVTGDLVVIAKEESCYVYKGKSRCVPGSTRYFSMDLGIVVKIVDEGKKGGEVMRLISFTRLSS